MGNSTLHRATVAALALAAAALLAGCGERVSTSSFRGESKQVAQAISDFQSNVSTAKEKDVCQKNLTSALRQKLTPPSSSCQHTLTEQLGQVDNFSLSISSIAIKGSTATATVKSTYSGKTRLRTMTLLKEGGSWRISGLY